MKIFTIDDIFNITGRGTVIMGTCESDFLELNQEFIFLEEETNKFKKSKILKLSLFRKPLERYLKINVKLM